MVRRPLFFVFLRRCIESGTLWGTVTGLIYASTMLARHILILASAEGTLRTSPIQMADYNPLLASLEFLLGAVLVAVGGAGGGIIIGLLSGVAMYGTTLLFRRTGLQTRVLHAIGTLTSLVIGWISIHLVITIGDTSEIDLWWHQAIQKPFDIYIIFDVILGHILFVQILPVALAALAGFLISRDAIRWLFLDYTMRDNLNSPRVSTH